MLQAKFEIIERCFQISRGAGIHEFPEKTFAAFEALAGFFALLFEQGDVVANGLNRFQQGGMSLYRLGVRGLLADGETSFAQKFLKERVHGLEAIRVASVVSQQDVILQKIDVVLHAVEEDKAVLAKFVEGREVLSEEGAAGLGDNVVFDIHDDLRYLQSDAADDGAARRLQFR